MNERIALAGAVLRQAWPSIASHRQGSIPLLTHMDVEGQTAAWPTDGSFTKDEKKTIVVSAVIAS